MPGFNTHYFFGKQNLEAMEKNEVTECCKKYSSAFSLGLQGPDLFFYFAAAGFCRGKNLGSLLHVEDTGLFFHNMYKYLRKYAPKKEREICIAYLAGFLGHYSLDCRVHPFIYARTDYDKKDNQYFGRHVFLETDIDVLLLQQFAGSRPSEFSQYKAIYLGPAKAKALSKMLHYAVCKTYGRALSSRMQMYLALRIMPLGCFLLHDKSGRKKAWIRKMETFVPGYPILSPLVPSDTLLFTRDPFNLHQDKWQNPWDPDDVSHLSFFDLYEKAGIDYRQQLYTLNRALVDNSPWAKKAFFQTVGNLSYHSGLDCEREKEVSKLLWN